MERTSVARKGAKRRGEVQRRANARAAAGSWQIQRAVLSSLEQLEGRQLFASTVQQGTDAASIAVAGNYLAWQAETGFKQIPGPAGNMWTFESNPDVTGMKAPSAGNSGTSVNTPGLQWTLNVANAGNYKLYVRRTIAGGQNSFWAPAVDAGTGIGTAPFTPVAVNAQSRFDEAADSNVPTWSSQRDGNAAQSFVYTMPVNAATNFDIRAREGPGYVIDRMVLATNAGLTGDQLDSLADSNVVRTVPDQVPSITALSNGTSVHLTWAYTYDADTYIIDRSDDNGATFTNLAETSDRFYDDGVPTAPKNYVYRITSKNTIGTGTPKTANVNVDGTIGGPSNIRVIQNSATAVGFQFDNPNGATGFTIERATLDASGVPGTFAAIATNVPVGNIVSGTGTATAYIDASAADNGAASYAYRIKTENSFGTGIPSANIYSSTTLPLAGGQGWSAYFNDEYNNSIADVATPANADYVGLFNQALTTTGGNDSIRYPTTPSSFNNNGAGPGNTFTATFKGKVTVPVTANYTFYTASDDGIQLIVDGVNLFNIFTTGRGIPATDDVIPVKDAGGNPVVWLAGSTHDVEINWEQGGGGWDLRVQWAPYGDATRKAPIPLAAINPVAPQTSVASGAVGDQAVQVMWTQVDAVSYQVQRSNDNGATWNNVDAPVPATSATASYGKYVTGLTNGTAYQFRVVATNANGTSTSNAVTLTPTAQLPAQPTNVAATASTFTNLTSAAVNVGISWTAVPFATTYKLERAVLDAAGNPGAFTTVSDTIAGTATSFTEALPTGQKVVYRLTAHNGAGDSPASANTAIVNLVQGVHEYIYRGSSSWRGSYDNPGLSPNNSQYAANINSLRNIDDTFSRIYTGKLHISQTGDYTFATNSDDDSYVMVDGKLVANIRGWGIDSYKGASGDPNAPQPGTPTPLHLTAGQDVDVIYWQEEGGGGDYADMKWQASGLTGPVEAGGAAPTEGGALTVIPQSQFRLYSSTLSGVPAAPTVLAVSADPGSLGATTVKLSFNDVATNELHYQLEQAPVVGGVAGTFLPIARVGLHDNTAGQGATILAAGLLPTTTYAFRIRAENFEGVSTYSNELQVTTTTKPVTPGGTLTYYDNQWWGSPNQSTNGAQSPGISNFENQITIDNTTTATAKLIDFHSDDQNGQLAFGPPGDDGFQYSVVISGKLRSGVAGDYIFVTQSDDDSYFVVNGKVVAAYPGGHGDDTGGMTAFPITLAANTEYNYQYYMSEGGGGHGFHARWVTPDDPNGDPSAGGTNRGGYVNAPLIPFVGNAAGAGFTTNTEDTPTAPTLPAGGAGAVFSAVAANSVKVSFTDTANSEIRYVLERSTSPTFATLDAVSALPAVLSASATGGAGGAATTTVTGLAAGTTYYFRLRASNYDGASAALDLGSVTTLSLSAPDRPLARVQSNGDVKLTWNDVLPLGTKVSVTRSTDGGAFTEIAQVNQVAGGGANTYTDTSAHGGGPFTYRLQVIGGPGGTTSPTVDVPFVVLPISGDPADRPVNYGQGFPVPPSAGPGQTYEGPSMDLLLNAGGTSQAKGVPGMFDADGDGFASLRLTSTDNGEAVSVYSADQVDVVSKSWTSQFDFVLNSGAAADGFVFVLQNNSNTFVGGGGGSGGYNGIGSKAVGVGFDTYDSHSTTGIFLGDASGPTSNDEVNDPYTAGLGYGHGLNLNPGGTGVDLKGGRHLRAMITYDKNTQTMSEMVVDLDDANRVVFNYNYGTVDLATQLGGNLAWLGFSGATGGANEQVDINNWVFSYKGVVVNPQVDVVSSTVGDGTAQRSQVKTVSVKFNQAVTLQAGALKLTRNNLTAGGATDGTTTDISSVLGAPTSPDGGVTWVWTFTPDAGNVNVQANGSLTDGVYNISVDHTKVSGAGPAMAADYSGAKFHRLFGDINGNKTVNLQDYGQFRLTFGKPSSDPAYVAAFDYDSNNNVNLADYGQFRNRFGKTFSYT